MLYKYRATTEKLDDAFQQIHEAGDTVRDIFWLGGRDWIIICHKGPLEDPFAGSLADFKAALDGLEKRIERGVRRGGRDGQR